MVARIKSLCRNLFHREHNDAELDNEISAQLELMADQKIKEGMRPEEARRAAKIELGGVEQLKGVSTIDAQVLIVSAAIMLILATVAVSIPARRAMRVDPMVALRHE